MGIPVAFFKNMQAKCGLAYEGLDREQYARTTYRINYRSMELKAIALLLSSRYKGKFPITQFSRQKKEPLTKMGNKVVVLIRI